MWQMLPDFPLIFLKNQKIQQILYGKPNQWTAKGLKAGFDPGFDPANHPYTESVEFCGRVESVAS
jgi:hypothetical protein